MFHETMKCIDVRYHFVLDVTASGVLVVSKFGMQDNPADMMRKSLPIPQV